MCATLAHGARRVKTADAPEQPVSRRVQCREERDRAESRDDPDQGAEDEPLPQVTCAARTGQRSPDGLPAVDSAGGNPVGQESEASQPSPVATCDDIYSLHRASIVAHGTYRSYPASG